MPAIYHEGSWLGNATDPEVLVKDTVGWTGKNRAYSQTNNAVIAHIENGITYDVSWTGSATVTLKENSASGATITSGSTSPLSFTADADYELYFGSSATVTNIMVKDSRITDPTYEPYHESVEEEIEQIYAENGVLGAKNLLPYNTTSRTMNGVTFTANADGSVTANGTATARTAYELLSLSDQECLNKFGRQKYKSSGCPSGGSASTYFTYVHPGKHNNTWDTAIFDYGNGIEFEYDGLTRIFYSITVMAGTTVNNLTFYPMIRLASDPDDTYQPYAMTNRELTVNMLTALFSHPIRLTSSDNLDNVKTAGIYEIANSVPANAPSGLSGTTFSTLFVLSAGGSAAITQIYIQGGWRDTDKHIAIRGYGSSPLVWSTWRYITDSAS